MGDSQLSKKELKARVVDAKKQAKADKKFQKIQAKIDAKEAKKQAKINAVAGRWEQRLASTSSSSPRTTPPQATMPVVSKDSSDNDLNFFTMPAGKQNCHDSCFKGDRYRVRLSASSVACDVNTVLSHTFALSVNITCLISVFYLCLRSRTNRQCWR